MTALASRVLVAVVGLPVVLGIVYVGGWWLFGLAALAALVGLHELFWMARTLRPVVLAGYIGALGALLGAALGETDWMVAGFLSTLPLAFLAKGLGGTRQPTLVSVSATVLGSAWVGLGLAHLLLLRDIEDDGRLASFTVLLAVFAGDAAAFFVGRLLGRHKLAPAVSPGKTWEGFAAGTVVTVFTVWVALYETGFVDGWRSLVLGAVIAVVGPLGDLFESGIKRDMEVKDSGRLLLGHGGMLDRIDAHLFALPAAYYVIAAFGAA